MSPRTPIILMALGETLVWASLYYIFPALLLSWEADLGWSRSVLTGAISLAVVTSGLCGPLMGHLIDRGHGARVMGGAAILGAGAMAALSLVETQAQFYAVWIVIGVALSGTLYDPSFAVITRARGAGARRAITAVTLVAGFAGTIAFPAATVLSASFGWRGAVLIAAACVGFVVAPMLSFAAHRLAQEGVAEPASPENPSRGFLARGAFWWLALGFAAIALAHGTTLHHLLPYLDERAVPIALSVSIAALIGPSQVAGRVLMVTFAGGVPAQGLLILAFGLMGSSVLILGFGGTAPGILYSFVFLFGGAWGTVSILRPVVVREVLGGAGFGAKSGAMAVPFLLAAAAAPYLGALLWAAIGYRAMLGCLAGIALLGGLSVLAALRSRT